MDQDTELFKQLILTFETELEENLQRLTEALLLLEKGQLSKEGLKSTLELIFRTAHNIKGTARSLGLNNLAEIAHQMESLFSALQKNTIQLSAQLVDTCLEAADALRDTLQSFIHKKPLHFDLADLIQRLQNSSLSSSSSLAQEKSPEPVQPLPSMLENKVSDSIRVSLSNLDRISALMEELQVSKIAVDDHYLELVRLSAQSKQLQDSCSQSLFNSDLITNLTTALTQMQKQLRPHINELSHLNNSLQTEVRLLRLLPATTLTCNLPRTVRDLAKDLNKKVDLAITGDEVRVDKVILEGLKDPLIHLFRNAIDHGIESETERVERGKDPIGKINLDIRQEGNQIIIRVEDDGRGMDANSIARAALAKNLISSSDLEKMNEEDKLKLIFYPGFSTKDAVTTVSGRGFGLDAVKTNLEQLKGQVQLETVLHQGTAFILRLPLTLVSERGLMISCEDQVFALPSSDIERVLSLSAEQIVRVETSQAIQLDEHPIPLRSLADVLGLRTHEPALPDRLFIVVMRKGWQLMAFQVDEIIGEKEIVIKPLQAPLSQTPCVAGGTLSGNGQVILVLNPSDLMDAALHLTVSTTLHPRKEKTAAKARPHILVVDDSITTRTLEKNVLESRDYQVTVAVNGKEAWDLLQRQKFSLIITDVSMPIMDGYALTDRVKHSGEFKDLPVIIVTSLGSEAEKQRGMEAGANAYIVKSEFESSNLLEIISQLVQP